MRRFHRKRGVTFAEVLVAAAFLGVCSASLTDTATQSLSNIARVERRMVALTALKDRIEIEIQQAKASGTLGNIVTANETLPGNSVCVITTTPTASAYTGVVKIVGTATWPEVKGTRAYTEQIRLEVFTRSPDVD